MKKKLLRAPNFVILIAFYLFACFHTHDVHSRPENKCKHPLNECSEENRFLSVCFQSTRSSCAENYALLSNHVLFIHAKRRCLIS